MIKITITKITEYPETVEKYEATNGERYLSTYSIPKDMDYVQVTHPTGAMLRKEKDIYVQEMSDDDFSLSGVIKAVNQLS